MDLSIYIEPDLLMLIPVLNLTGYWIKNTGKIKSSYIPVILGMLSIVLCLFKALSERKYGNFFEYAFSSATQGILLSAAAVYSNQIYKQTVKNQTDTGITSKGGKSIDS
ncbi:MAG: phage holin family protein [Clostridia bacterium]|nr:phage holin family protein [Clostridia bacterium]